MTERIFEQRIEIILDTLRRRRCMLTYAELFNATGIKLSSLQTIVRSMVNTGKLQRNGRSLPARFGLKQDHVLQGVRRAD